MTTISSNTLFHFTPSAEYLISILTNNFQPRYCLEKLNIVEEEEIEIAIPMVCFCDIPLSQIKDHVNTYGNYGIGMTKKWAQTNALNPILYISEESKVLANLKEILITFTNEELRSIEQLRPATIAYLNIIRYLKQYEGDFSRGSTIIKNVKFYNEREWRYTPDWTDENPLFLSKNDFENPIKKAHANEKLKNSTLAFYPSDIAYIIVKEEKEIFSMITALKQIKGRYDPNTIEVLISRIITCDQILNDF